MKKTLIALAAVALSSAAFAQSSVTLSGKFGYAYQAKNDGTTGTTSAGKTNGFATTDGDVRFTAVEDLGGGLKATASMEVRVRGRGAAGVVDGRDSSLTLSGGFGSVLLGAIEAGNGIVGLGSAGAPVIGLDDTGNTLDKAANVDIARYITPDMGGLKAYVSIIDSIGAPGGGGLESTSATTEAVQVGLTYAAGPLAVAADYSSFSKNNSATVTKNFGRTRISGSYDLGVVKLGAGYQNKGASTTTGAKNNQYILGVSMPVSSNVLLGATYASNKTSGATATTGYELGVAYSFSKRTVLQAAYQSEKKSGLTADTHTRIRLMHTF